MLSNTLYSCINDPEKSNESDDPGVDETLVPSRHEEARLWGV
jgi:hypothetical protein